MKFEDFDLDLTKITKGYGVNPLDNGEAPDPGGTYSDGCWTRIPAECLGSWICDTIIKGPTK